MRWTLNGRKQNFLADRRAVLGRPLAYRLTFARLPTKICCKTVSERSPWY